MKQILLLCLLMAPTYINGAFTQAPNPLAAYDGKYQMTVRGKTGYINIITKNKQLVLIETWSGVENNLKRLAGDNFIVELRGWAVKFNRDKKGTVVSVLVMGHDLWTKVK